MTQQTFTGFQLNADDFFSSNDLKTEFSVFKDKHLSLFDRNFSDAVLGANKNTAVPKPILRSITALQLEGISNQFFDPPGPALDLRGAAFDLQTPVAHATEPSVTSESTDLETRFSQLYIFGDSLSDFGNVFNSTTFVQPFDQFFGIEVPVSPASPPYFEGRFSNGPIWVETFAEGLGKSLTPSSELSVFRPRIPFPSPVTLTREGLAASPFFNGNLIDNNVNFAYGGAQTGEVGLGGQFSELIPGLQTQVEWLTNDYRRSQQSVDPDALAIYFGGPNDYWSNPEANPEEIVASIETGLIDLFEVGVSNVLVANVADLGEVPRFNQAPGNLPPPFDPEIITALSEEHNVRLEATLDELEGLYPEVNIITLDVSEFFNNLLDDPDAFGFVNIENPCLNLVTGVSCDHPDEYLFWDDIHPTTATHEQLGNFALETLAAEFGTSDEFVSELGSVPVEIG